MEDINYQELAKIYSKAKIYWHAAGAGEDTDTFPQKAEHFGISTVEAMSAGVVPVVINAGGQKEIVEDGFSGFLWNSKEELIDKTGRLINNELLLKELSENAEKRSGDFSPDNFNKSLASLIT